PSGGVGKKCPGDPPTDSLTVQYTVRSQDIVGGKVTASVRFQATNSLTDPLSPDVPDTTTTTPATITPCPSPTPCVNSFCDPTLHGTGADASRLGVCTTSG